MEKLLIISEVYNPEEFIINDIVKELSKYFTLTVLTRCPSYPKGSVFKGYRNTFTIRNEGGIRVIRYPVFLNYNKYKALKIANLLWQPIVNLVFTTLLKYDKIFVYQTGSIYSYSFLFQLRLKKSQSIIWSQDLWPEAGYEIGFPEFWPLNKLLTYITQITLKHFRTILVQSESFRDYYTKKYKVSSEVIYNFSVINKSHTYPSRKENTSLVYAGNIGSVQNTEELIQLYLKIKNPITPLQTFEIYGDGSRYLALAQKYVNYPDIKFYGRVDLQTVGEALKNCLYAAFSLVEGPINKTIPSRLQFFYNNNIPMLYLGGGEPANFINDKKCGIVIKSLNDEVKLIQEKIENFEKNEFITNDVFNKKLIIGKLVKIISDFENK